MTYKEWIVNNWTRGRDYKSAVARLERAKSDLSSIEYEIGCAKNGQIDDTTPTLRDTVYPFRNDKTFHLYTSLSEDLVAKAFGVSPKELKHNRWEREALEEEDRVKRGIERFMQYYRDGIYDTTVRHFEVHGSVPYLKKEIEAAQSALNACVAALPYDWIKNINNPEWYDESVKVLNGMLDILTFWTECNFDEEFANYINELSNGRIRFTFDYRIKPYFVVCSVSNEHIKSATKVRRKDDNLWSATLRALLDFINENWEALYKQVYG